MGMKSSSVRAGPKLIMSKIDYQSTQLKGFKNFQYNVV